jgi:ribosome-associated protein
LDIRKLQRAIVDGLEDVKAHDIVVFNTEHLSPLFERVIIASGTSNRQTKALASSVRDSVKGSGFPVMRTEGEDNGEWIIVDCGAAVAHIMQPAIRDYYHLEEIWGSKPVKMKLTIDAKGLPKAAPTKPAPKTASRSAPKPAAGKAGPRKTASSKAAADKSPARKTVAKKAPARGSVTRKVGVKSATASATGTRAAAAKPAARKRPRA